MLNTQQGRSRTIHLVRRQNASSLGFAIRGGIEYNVGIFVSEVDPGSEAALQGLKVGDQIVRVNGLSVEQAVHSEVIRLLKNRSQVLLKVRRRGILPVRGELVRSGSLPSLTPLKGHEEPPPAPPMPPAPRSSISVDPSALTPPPPAPPPPRTLRSSISIDTSAMPSVNAGSHSSSGMIFSSLGCPINPSYLDGDSERDFSAVLVRRESTGNMMTKPTSSPPVDRKMPASSPLDRKMPASPPVDRKMPASPKPSRNRIQALQEEHGIRRSQSLTEFQQYKF